MSFGGGFGGFGSNNNQQQQSSTTFGGFGSSNTGAGFGQQQNTTFGSSNNTGSSLFGGGGTGFGSGASAFNAPKPFGTTTNTTGSTLFGGSSATTGTTGFGGFGSNTNTTSNFGSSNTGSSLFGGNKPGFGASNSSTGGGIFGNSNTGGGFGATSSSTGVFGGAQNNQECPGTGSTPFSEHTEKESNTAVTNHYQSITFMQPYQKWSFEELRLADYNAGRRFGNGSGQAGAFGTSTGFGGFGQSNNQNQSSGFGNSGGGLFGANNTSAAGGFGTNTQTTGGFGGGGLFSQNKPAGGLFGSTTSTTATGGGLFSTAGTNTSTGFGTQQNTAFGGATGSSLFGSNQNQQKQGTLTFGQNTTTATGNTGFGGGFGGGALNSNNNSGGSLFGQNQNQNQGNNLFGNQQQQQQQTGGSLFGQQNQNQTQGTGFGGFGQNNQAKPGGLFGNTTNNTTGASLFNQNQNNQQTQAGTNLFNQPANTSGGSLFGPKPAQTGGLFGQNTGAGGGSLFGASNQNQQQQNQSSGLFGGLNNAGGSSLFGQKPAQTGTSLFGSSQQQGQSNNLFGGQNNQNQGSGLFGGLNSSAGVGNQQNALQGPPALTASALDANPYGSASIFSGLPPPPQQSPGPIATPISAGQKQKKSAALPQFKINPAMASRFSTPQKRGYGFTYSTYGTPSSVSSAASTPGGLSSSLLTSSIGRNLGKSFSTSNLRRTFDNDGDSILSPGAFSANSNRYGTGSLKKLNIDRSLRTDLFGNHAVAALPAPERSDASRTPSIKKKVSFDASTVGGNGSGSPNGAPEHENSTPSAQEQGFMRSRTNGVSTVTRSHNGINSPSKDAGQSTELTTVHEDGSPQASSNNALILRDQADPELGDYWTKPPLAELKKWPRGQLKSVSDFEVGRRSGGYVHFEEPVDLTTVDLDSICGTVVVIEMRSLTVYPTNVSKPPIGQGLNVPSVITLENSWPRQRDKKTPSFETSGPRFEKHVKRLASVSDTQFISYSAGNGEWTFRVPHFTTYGLDYDDDDMTEQSDMEGLGSSVLSEAQSLATPTPTNKLDLPGDPHAGEFGSSVASDVTRGSSRLDDTFDFKKRQAPPGAFDETVLFDDEVEMAEVDQHNQSFLGQRSADLPSEDDEQDEPSELPEVTTQEPLLTLHEDSAEESIDVVGAFPGFSMSQNALLAMSLHNNEQTLGTPRKTLVDEDIDWMEQLQRTISPRKQDRHNLRQSQAVYLKDQADEIEVSHFQTGNLRSGEITTSIDLMNSLFGKEEARRTAIREHPESGSKSFKWPYPKSKPLDQSQLNDAELAFHASFKPSWSRSHRLLYVAHDEFNASDRDVCTMKFERSKDINAKNFHRQKDQSKIALEHGVPKARAHFLSYAANRDCSGTGAAYVFEGLLWKLASILFDEHDNDSLTINIPKELRSSLEDRLRKDRLSEFWSSICERDALNAVARAHTNEERAIAFLSCHKISEACACLTDGKDYRLATLIAQTGADQTMRDDMAAQIEEWRKLNVLSEMTDPIRALYELVAGNTARSVGKRGPVEDRAKSFFIPERFNLDWKRAFGLKLWYGTRDDEPLELAVQQYAADLCDTEARKPLPYFLEDDKNTLPWHDPNAQSREDALWGLLKLYSQRQSSETTADLAQTLMPENTVGLPMSFRLPFELYRALAPQFPQHTSAALGDALFISFTTELEAAGQWIWAILVALHLSDAQSRQMAVQSILARNAELVQESNVKVWTCLVSEFKIPVRWLWEAKALYARSTTGVDPTLELQYLLNAQNADEAHRLLVQTVGPLKVVEQDYNGLQNVLNGFNGVKPKGWEHGGNLYADLIKLTQGGLGPKEKKTLIGRLFRNLTQAAGRGGKTAFSTDVPHDKFLQRVALRDISRIVGDALLEEAGDDTDEQAGILQLPLNPETKVLRAREMSWNYYRKVMSSIH